MIMSTHVGCVAWCVADADALEAPAEAVLGGDFLSAVGIWVCVGCGVRDKAGLGVARADARTMCVCPKWK